MYEHTKVLYKIANHSSIYNSYSCIIIQTALVFKENNGVMLNMEHIEYIQ